MDPKTAPKTCKASTEYSSGPMLKHLQVCISGGVASHSKTGAAHQSGGRKGAVLYCTFLEALLLVQPDAIVLIVLDGCFTECSVLETSME